MFSTVKVTGRSSMLRWWLVSVLLLVSTLMIGCSESAEDSWELFTDILELIPEDTDADNVQATDDGSVEPTGLIAGVTSGVEAGDYYPGAPPQRVGSLALNPLNDGSVVSIIAGGSTVLSVSSEQPFSTIYVLSDNNGYYQLLLPEAVRSTDVVVSYSADSLATGESQIDVSVSDAGGAVSNTHALFLRVGVVSEGEAQ